MKYQIITEVECDHEITKCSECTPYYERFLNQMQCSYMKIIISNTHIKPNWCPLQKVEEKEYIDQFEEMAEEDDNERLCADT